MSLNFTILDERSKSFHHRMCIQKFAPFSILFLFSQMYPSSSISLPYSGTMSSNFSIYVEREAPVDGTFEGPNPAEDPGDINDANGPSLNGFNDGSCRARSRAYIHERVMFFSRGSRRIFGGLAVRPRSVVGRGGDSVRILNMLSFFLFEFLIPFPLSF